MDILKLVIFCENFYSVPSALRVSETLGVNSLDLFVEFSSARCKVTDYRGNLFIIFSEGSISPCYFW